MHKDDPNTANPSPLEAVPAADFDLVQPPYLVCVMLEVSSVHELFVTLPWSSNILT